MSAAAAFLPTSGSSSILFRQSSSFSISFGIQTQSFAARGNPDDWRKQVERWRELGATHVALSTMNAGLAKPDDHLRVLREYWDAVSG